MADRPNRSTGGSRSPSARYVTVAPRPEVGYLVRTHSASGAEVSRSPQATIEDLVQYLSLVAEPVYTLGHQIRRELERRGLKVADNAKSYTHAVQLAKADRRIGRTVPPPADQPAGRGAADPHPEVWADFASVVSYANRGYGWAAVEAWARGKVRVWTREECLHFAGHMSALWGIASAQVRELDRVAEGRAPGDS